MEPTCLFECRFLHYQSNKIYIQLSVSCYFLFCQNTGGCKLFVAIGSQDGRDPGVAHPAAGDMRTAEGNPCERSLVHVFSSTGAVEICSASQWWFNYIIIILHNRTRTNGQIKECVSDREERINEDNYRFCTRQLIRNCLLTHRQVILIPSRDRSIFGIREFLGVFGDCVQFYCSGRSSFAEPKYAGELNRLVSLSLVWFTNNVYRCCYDHRDICNNQAQTVLDLSKKTPRTTNASAYLD